MYTKEGWLVGTCDYSSTLAKGSASAFMATLTSQVFTEPDGTQHRLEDTTFTVAPETGGEKCITPIISAMAAQTE